MAFTPKDWRNGPDQSTPLSAAALEDLETRLAAYSDSQDNVESSVRASGDSVLNSAILAEANARAAADTDLQNQIAAHTVGSISEVPGLSAALALLQDKATAATDTELAAAISAAQSALNTAIALKQDASTAATDSELSTGLALKQDAATAATDAELSSAISALNSAITTSLASKQDASLAATDVEVEAIRATLAAADALKIPLSQKGVANGVATLASDGLLDATQVRGASGVDSAARNAIASTKKLTSYVSFIGETSASFPPMARPIDATRMMVAVKNLGATAEQVQVSSNTSANYNGPNWTGAASLPVGGEVVVSNDTRALHFRTTVDTVASLTAVFTEQGVL